MGLPLIIRKVMPIATACPVMPGRAEILLALLLAFYLAAELLAPVAVQIICAAFFVPIGIAVAAFRISRQGDEDIVSPSPILASLAPRAPPLS